MMTVRPPKGINAAETLDEWFAKEVIMLSLEMADLGAEKEHVSLLLIAIAYGLVGKEHKEKLLELIQETPPPELIEFRKMFIAAQRKE